MEMQVFSILFIKLGEGVGMGCDYPYLCAYGTFVFDFWQKPIDFIMNPKLKEKENAITK